MARKTSTVNDKHKIRIAYIMSRFPKITETFILYEILALEKAGFDVHLASNGLEGVRCVQSEEFHLIITDQQMPVMDGTQFCSESD